MGNGTYSDNAISWDTNNQDVSWKWIYAVGKPDSPAGSRL